MTDQCLLCNSLLSLASGRGQFCPRCSNSRNLHYVDKCNDCGFLVHTTDKDFTLCEMRREKRKRRYMIDKLFAE